jgi:hypothetical protein
MMAKPPTRTPQTALPEARSLAPAPDNGVHPAEAAQPAPTAGRGKSKLRQIGPRVPGELYDRLVRCSEETGVPQAFLVQHGLERELTERGY